MTLVKLVVGEPAPGRCARNVRFESDTANAEIEVEAIRDTLVTQVLPSIDVKSLAEIEYVE